MGATKPDEQEKTRGDYEIIINGKSFVYAHRNMNL